MKRILLIDDDELSNYINGWTIKQTEQFEEIHINRSATGGLNYLNRLISENRKLPEYILLDIYMPNHNGYWLLDELKKLPAELLTGTRIVMLTNSLHPNDRLRSLEYELVAGFLSKPLCEDTVRRFLIPFKSNKPVAIIYG